MEHGAFLNQNQADILEDFTSLCLYGNYQRIAEEAGLIDSDWFNVENHDMINNPSDGEIAICYLWYATKLRDPRNALNAKWIFDNKDPLSTTRFGNSMTTKNLTFDNGHKKYSENKDFRLLKAVVLEDLFRYSYKVFINKIKEKGYLDTSNDWQIVPCPEYYCIQYKNNKDWIILRYS